MVHAGLKKTFAMQTTPETDRAELRLRRQCMAREVDFHFIRVQIDVVKNNDPFDRLLDNLRTPAGFLASIVTFASMKSEKLPGLDQVDERFAGRTKGVVIWVRP